jgi:CubicO group peptidase (beta-lactamase class C family)
VRARIAASEGDRARRPSATFREFWQYNNWMVMAAGYIAAQVQGNQSSSYTWEQMVQEKIFTPLQMTNTFPTFANSTNAANKALPTFKVGDARASPPRTRALTHAHAALQRHV